LAYPIDFFLHIISLPKKILDALGVQLEAEVIIELMETGVVIKPKHPITPITERIAAMNLPVADWDQMEQEIEFVTRVDPLAYTPTL